MTLLARILIAVSLVCFGQHLYAEKIQYSDGMVRAAVIFGILRFAEWPEISQPIEAMNLCSQGSSPSSEAISSFKNIPSIGQTKINYIPKYDGGNEQPCHALILGEGSIDLSVIQETTLLICDKCENGFRNMSAIELLLKDDRVQFDINLDIVQRQDISLSASLIELAARCTSSDPAIRGCND